ncbi:hypothetical protein HMPREF0262_01327 [Clostridium sp. ATCC 29733]|nr:hypothetical protein HMPREF0262_01327 [Clostridium sp. ATCC 29733]
MEGEEQFGIGFLSPSKREKITRKVGIVDAMSAFFAFFSPLLE